MDTALRRISFQVLTDKQLLLFLSTAADRLPLSAVEEGLRRGASFAGLLTELCRAEESWRQSGAAYWTPVHATFILGALEDEVALRGLLAALRWSVYYDVDWVHAQLPSLFGPLGRAAIAPLRAHVADASGSEAGRVTAIRCLAGVAAHHPIHQGEILDSLRVLADDDTEPDFARLAAAEVLVAFVRPGDRGAAAGAAIRQQWSDRPASFDVADVEAAWARGEQRLEGYRRDWLDFYTPEAVEVRQRRWRAEAEDRRWARGTEDGAPWVEEQRQRFLTKFEFTLGDCDDQERGDACWVSEALVEYLVWHEGAAPWRLNGSTVFGYLMDTFARRVTLDHPGCIEAVPPQLLRFARFCAEHALIAEEDLADVERVVAEEQDAFVSVALDPERRRIAREVLDRMVAAGIDPRDPDRGVLPASPLPPSKERPTSRRQRPR